MSRPGATPPLDRLLKRITIDENGCWIYPTLNENGYGVIGRGGRNGPTMRTHRLTYEQFVGPIPDGLEIDHLCRVRSCCNPEHLEAVTRTENIRRGLRKQHIAKCKKGHDLTFQGKQRSCLVCRKERDRARWLAIKADPVAYAAWLDRQNRNAQLRRERAA